MGFIYNGKEINELYFGKNQVGILKFGSTTIWRYSPAVPNFSINADDDTNITITFIDGRVRDSISYTILYGETSNPATEITTENESDYTLSSLKPNTKYYFKVRANGEWDNSEYASIQNVTTPPDAPIPSSLTWDITSIKLLWSATAGSTRYYIERRKGLSGAFSEITYVSSTEYLDSGLEVNTGYQYRIRAYNANGFSAYSLYNTRSTGYNPTRPTLSSGNVTSTSISLEWTTSTGSGYYLEKKVGDGAFSVFKTINSNATTSHTDSGLSENTSYAYRIRAFKTYSGTDGVSSYSGNIEETTPPAAPVGLSASTNGTDSVYLSWSPSSGATRYYIDKKASGGSWQAVTYSTTTNYTVSSLASNTAHEFRIRSYSSHGFSPYSSIESANTGFNPNSTTLTITSVESSSIVMSWVKVAEASGYYIDRKTGSGSWVVGHKTINSASTLSLTDSVSANTSYSYRIRAFKTYSGTDGVSSYSAIQTRTSAPNSPAISSISTSGIDSLTVNWGGVSGATRYRLERRISSGSFTSLGDKTGTSFIDTGLSSSTTYEYRMKSGNSHGLSASYSSIKGQSTGFVPDAPELSLSSRTTSSITISWGSIAEVTGYYLDRKIGTGSWSSVATLKSSVTSYSNNSLSQGQTYSYRIRAYKTYSGTDGVSSYSSELSVVVLTELSTPTGLAVSSSSGTSLTLGWNTVSSASGYTVQRSTNSSFSSDLVTQEPSSTSLSISGLSAGTTYYFRVLAKGSGDYESSSYSSGLEYLTSIPINEPPYSFTSGKTHNGTTIKWNAPSNAPSGVEYDLYLSLRSDFGDSMGSYRYIIPDDEREIVLTESTNKALAPNTTYYYKIRAVDPTDDMAPSTFRERNFTTTKQGRAEVTDFDSTATSTEAVLSWSVSTTSISAGKTLAGTAINETLEGFTLQISSSSTFSTTVVDTTLAASARSYTFTTSDKETFYARILNKGTGDFTSSSYTELEFSTLPAAILPEMTSKGDIFGDSRDLRLTYKFGTEEAPKTWEWQVYRWDYKTSSSGSYNLVRQGTDVEKHTGIHYVTPWINYAAGFRMKVRIRIQGSDTASASAWYEDIISETETTFMLNVLQYYSSADYMFHGGAAEGATTSSLSVGYIGGYLRDICLDESVRSEGLELSDAFKNLDGYNNSPVYKAKAGQGWGGYNLMGILVTEPDLAENDAELSGLRSANSTDNSRYTVKIYTTAMVDNITPHNFTSQFQWWDYSDAFIDTTSAAPVNTIQVHSPYHIDISGLTSGRPYKLTITKNEVTIDGITYGASKPQSVLNSSSYNDLWMASRPCEIVANITLPAGETEYTLELGSDMERDGQEYSVTVNWGDGSDEESFAGYNSKLVKHDYSSVGNKTVTVSGILAGFNFSYSSYSSNPSAETYLRSITIKDGSFQDFTNLFKDDEQLTTVDLSNMNKSYVLQTDSMFENCINLTSVIGTSSMCNSFTRVMQQMFRNCPKLTMVDFTGWDTKELQEIDYMFDECTALSVLKGTSYFIHTAGADHATVTESLRGVFKGCANLSAEDLAFIKNWDIKWVYQFTDFLNGVGSNLTAAQFGSLDLRGWNFEHLMSQRYNNMHDWNAGPHQSLIYWNQPSGGSHAICFETYC